MSINKPQEAGSTPRKYIDNFLGYEIEFTVADIQEMEEKSRKELEDYSNPEYALALAEKIIASQRAKIQPVIDGDKPIDGIVINLVFFHFNDDEKAVEFNRTKDPKLITDEVLENHRKHFIKYCEDSAKETIDRNTRYAELIEARGADGICSDWNEVLAFIREIANTVQEDIEIYKAVKAKFPDFINKIGDYMAFIRGKEWDSIVELLLAQAAYTSRMMNYIQLQKALIELEITIVDDIDCPVVGLIEGKPVEFSIGDVIEGYGKVVGFYGSGPNGAVVLFDETKMGKEAVKMIPFDKSD